MVRKYLLAVVVLMISQSARAKEETQKDALGEIQVDAPELEFKRIGSSIRKLEQQVRAVPRTSSEPGLGPQVTEAKRAFSTARDAFAAKDWHGVVQECSRFFNLSQKPEPETWLKAQYMIGRAYDELGQNQKAVRAYRRYLATFTTRPSTGLEDLTEVFERVVRIATKSSEANQIELSNFLSSIAAMQYPEDVSAELKYLTAVAGSNIGKRKLASQWLGNIDDESVAPETRARAKYYQALMAISRKNWDEAALQLEPILQMTDITKKSKENAKIALARVFIKQKKPNLSLKMYSQIEETSENYCEAEFEKTFLLVRMGRDQEARDAAKAWLKKYPNHQNTRELSSILAWLDLKAGDLDAAKQGIESSTTKLSQTKAAITNDFHGTILSHDDAMRLSTMTKGLVEPARELDEILLMFDQLGEMKQRLAEVDGAERALIYSIAKGDLRHFKPSLTNRIDQYDLIADEVLKVGSRLVFVEKERLKGVLSEVDKQKLAASEKRRMSLFSKRSQLSRQLNRWASWAEPAELLIKLAEDWQKLSRLEAEMRGKTRELTAQSSSVKQSDVREFEEKVQSLRKGMVGLLTDIRKAQAASLVEQSSINDILYIIQQFATALHEESQIISAYEPQTGKILDALDDEDSRNTWAAWQDLIGELYTGIKDLKLKAGRDLADVFTSLEKINKTRVAMENDLQSLKSILETYGGESLAGILAHYDNALSQRLARQYKWSGDLEYLNYAKVKNEHATVIKKQALETQILNDNLQDAE